MAFNHSNQLVSRVYEMNHAKLISYIRRMICNIDDVEDLAQDVFLRLLGYGENLQESTVVSLMYKIATNLVNDYLRHLYTKNEVQSELRNNGKENSYEVESEIYAHDMKHIELKKLDSMPKQRRVVYMLRIHEEKTTQEVADFLNVSRRTVENHFYIGLKEMREYFKACV